MNGVPAAAIRLILQVDHMQGDVADCDAQSGRLKLVYINLIYNLYTIYIQSIAHGFMEHEIHRAIRLFPLTAIQFVVKSPFVHPRGLA